MYCFTPYANENQLKTNADNYNVELISDDKTIHRTEWKITRADGVYTYSLTKFGNDYHLRLDGEYEKFYCVFSMIDGDICIQCGERDGKNLKAASRLKAFSQIVVSMWDLFKSEKYHNKLSALPKVKYIYGGKFND